MMCWHNQCFKNFPSIPCSGLKCRMHYKDNKKEKKKMEPLDPEKRDLFQEWDQGNSLDEIKGKPVIIYGQ